MSGQPKASMSAARTVARLRALARTDTSSPLKLMLGGVFGVALLAVFFMTGTFTAIGFIDDASVASEEQRAAVALDVVLGDEGAMPDTATAERIAHQFALKDARIASVGSLRPGETAITIPGATSLLAWVPRRFASEAFETVAPMRLGFGILVICAIFFIMLRLNGLARDLEARRLLAHALASRDALTGLKNRLTFDQELREAFGATPQLQRPLALLYLDLDAFKSVNDTHGHIAGDQLLRMAGERLTLAVAPTDSVARLGGDEFAVLRPGGGTRAELIELAVRIRTTLSAPFPLDGTLVTIGVSIGIAVAPTMATTAESLVRAADVALYRAKAEGEAHYAFAIGNVRQTSSTGGRRTAAA